MASPRVEQAERSETKRRRQMRAVRVSTRFALATTGGGAGYTVSRETPAPFDSRAVR